MKCALPAPARGAGLVIALVVLTLMSVAALALVRSVATSQLVAGNFAFRQAAVLAADGGAEAAVAWLTARRDSATLFGDQPTAGYYASLLPGIDLTGTGGDGATAAIDWDADGCQARPGLRCLQPSPATGPDPAGHRIRYLIQRLCRRAGSPDAAANSCLLARSGAASGTRDQLSYGSASRFQPDDAVYYRITVHARGPRNTTAFTQTLVHF